MLPHVGHRGNKIPGIFSDVILRDGITKCQLFSQAKKNLNRMIAYQLKQQYYYLGLWGFYHPNL